MPTSRLLSPSLNTIWDSVYSLVHEQHLPEDQWAGTAVYINQHRSKTLLMSIGQVFRHLFQVDDDNKNEIARHASQTKQDNSTLTAMQRDDNLFCCRHFVQIKLLKVKFHFAASLSDSRFWFINNGSPLYAPVGSKFQHDHTQRTHANCTDKDHADKWLQWMAL